MGELMPYEFTIDKQKMAKSDQPGDKQRTSSERSSAYSSDPNQTDRNSQLTVSPNYPRQQQPLYTRNASSVVEYPSLPMHDMTATTTTCNTIVHTSPPPPDDNKPHKYVPTHLQPVHGEEPRESWDQKIDFLLSVIGFAVDLANIWRFPYLCYKNGGGVFLIPYVCMVVTAGVPLFYMELALGQYYRSGAITCWGKICPLFKGIGYCVVMSAFFVDFFYNVIISWAIRFFFESAATFVGYNPWLPWASCKNPWNGPCCYDLDMLKQNSSDLDSCMTDDLRERLFEGRCNVTDLSSSAEEYFRREFLGYVDTNTTTNESYVRYHIDNLGPVNYKNMLALGVVYLICYFSLWKGIKMSGKVVWFTAIFPYIVLFVLFVYGIFLPGSSNGIHFYLFEPNMTKLWDGTVWMDAATQVFFSLGPGFGVLLAFSSYNEFHNNIYQDALVTSVVNCMTSFLSGFVIFMMLGYMSCRSGKPISEVAVEGTGLVFVVYPEALSTMPMASIWSMLFFLMLLTLGLDSSFGGSEAIITAISDEFPILKNYRELFVGVLFGGYYLVGIVQCTRGGYFLEEWISFYGTKYGLVIAVLIETIVVSWIYDLRRFKRDIKEMLGFEPGTYWCFCWAVFGPAFLMFNMLFGMNESQWMPALDGMPQPDWFQYLGMALAISSALSIPIVCIIQIIIAPGRTLKQKLRWSITPWKVTVENEKREKSIAEAHSCNGPPRALLARSDLPPAVPPHGHQQHPAALTTSIPTGHNMIVTLQRTTDDIML